MTCHSLGVLGERPDELFVLYFSPVKLISAWESFGHGVVGIIEQRYAPVNPGPLCE